MAQDGKFIIIKVGTTTIKGQISGSDEATVDMLETTDKLTKDAVTGITHKTFIAGDRNSTLTIEGNFDQEDDNWETLYALYRTQVATAVAYFGGVKAGDTFIEQAAWLSNVTRTYGQNAVATYSASLQLSGVPTLGTVPT